MTYGEHAEAAAEALTKLVNRDRHPETAGDVDLVLEYREHLLDALDRQLRHLGANRGFPAARELTVRDIGGNAVNLLHHLVDEAPRVPGARRRAPSDVLGSTVEHANVDVDLWRQAATAATIAAGDLEAARHRPWLHDAGAGWYLVGDLANMVEAATVLDARLADVGILDPRPAPASGRGLSVNDRRMVCAHAARLATWQATSLSPDLAVAEDVAGGQVRGPVVLVSGPVDLAPAQRSLAALLRHLPGQDSFSQTEPSIDVATARAVVVGQGRLAATLSVAAALNQDTLPLKTMFRDRQLRLAEIQTRMAPLTDVVPRVNRPAIIQQQEISQAVRRISGEGMAPAQMLDIADATHKVTHRLAAALRHELHRKHSNLRLATREGHKQPTRKHGLSVAASNLAEAPPPIKPTADWGGALQRAMLRNVLDTTPTGRRQNPYPRPPVGATTGWSR